MDESVRKFFFSSRESFSRIENFFMESRILSPRREFLPRVENIFAELRIISSSRILTTSREYFSRVKNFFVEPEVFHRRVGNFFIVEYTQHAMPSFAAINYLTLWWPADLLIT